MTGAALKLVQQQGDAESNKVHFLQPVETSGTRALTSLSLMDLNKGLGEEDEAKTMTDLVDPLLESPTSLGEVDGLSGLGNEVVARLLHAAKEAGHFVAMPVESLLGEIAGEDAVESLISGETRRVRCAEMLRGMVASSLVARTAKGLRGALSMHVMDRERSDDEAPVVTANPIPRLVETLNVIEGLVSAGLLMVESADDGNGSDVEMILPTARLLRLLSKTK